MGSETLGRMDYAAIKKGRRVNALQTPIDGEEFSDGNCIGFESSGEHLEDIRKLVLLPSR